MNNNNNNKNNNNIDDASKSQSLNNNSDRNIIKTYENQFQNLIRNNNYNSLDENNFNTLLPILNFIFDKTESVKLDSSFDSAIFLMGATGSGKSTFLNYLNYGDNAFKLTKNKRYIQLIPEINSNITIGDGDGSTTLFPNIKKTEFGNFIDFAGECDTDGILSKFILSIIKQKISNNVKNIKIIFVSQQDSLACTAQYGYGLKESLKNNSTFLKYRDIENFNQSMGMVITKAGYGYKGETIDDVRKECEGLLKSIENHNNFDDYKIIIKSILDDKRFSTFSNAGDLSLNIYTPPLYNLNQKEELIKFVNSIPYTKIPDNEEFKVTIPNEIKDEMNKIFEIILIKTWNTINKSIMEYLNKPFKFYSIETISLFKFIKQLVYGYETNLSNFLNILNYNSWFKIKDQNDISLLNNLNEKINYFNQLINGDNSEFKCDWILKSNVKSALDKILVEIEDNVGPNGGGINSFEKFVSNDTIEIVPSAINLLDKFNELKELLQQQENIKSLKDQSNSIYYDDKIVPIQEIENYTEEETKTRRVPKIRNVTTKEIIQENVPVTKYRDEKVATKVLPGIKGHPKHITVEYQVLEPRDREVEKTTPETYYVDEKYIESVSKQRTITVGQITTRVFNETKYNDDKNRVEREIEKLRNSIFESLSSFGYQQSQNNNTNNNNEQSMSFEDLKKLWCQVEFFNYTRENPNNFLDQSYDIKSKQV